MSKKGSTKSAANSKGTKSAPSVAQVAAEICAQLRRTGDPVRARGAQQYFRNEIVCLGIRAPALRVFVRDKVQGLQQGWGVQQAVQLCDRLLSEPELEIRGAGFLALGSFRRMLSPAFLTRAEVWLESRLDNWALVDGFCSSVLSPLLENHDSVVATLQEWSGAKSLWVRRAALVTLIPFARHGKFLDLSYDLAREHFADIEDPMHKATGWLLRETGKTNTLRLKRFLLQNGPSIPRTTLRYAIERFPAAERSKLLNATRAQAPAPRNGKRGLGQPAKVRTRSPNVRSK